MRPLSEIIIEIDVESSDLASLTLAENLNEVAEDGKQTTGFLKVLDIIISEISSILLQGVFESLGLLDQRTYDPKLWVVLLLGLQIISHLKL